MSNFTVRVTGKRLTVNRVWKMFATTLSSIAGATVNVTQDPELKTRAQRFAHAQDLAAEAENECVMLCDELQAWRDGLPENLQSGSKADQLEEAISVLEEAASGLNEVVSLSIKFPRMMR